jgi:hypothetical protein
MNMPSDALFYYKTPVGTFWIRAQPGAPGRYWLGCEDDALGSYATPAQAADDMATGHSGHVAWDRNPRNAPYGLAEWVRR